MSYLAWLLCDIASMVKWYGLLKSQPLHNQALCLQKKVYMKLYISVNILSDSPLGANILSAPLGGTSSNVLNFPKKNHIFPEKKQGN